MPNLLFVSIAFPPKNDPECVQTAKYFKYLVADKRLSISVVTSAMPTLFMEYDNQLESYAQGYQQQISLPIYETKLTNFALRKIWPGGIDFPDSKFSFHLQAKRVLKQLKQKPDVIYSRSNPLSSALLAYKLKKHYNIPWIMHLSDPWVGSPVHTYKGKQLDFHQQWQDSCFKEADTIGLTSETTIEFYQKQYPQFAHKLKFFPNVFDPEMEKSTPFDWGKKLRIVYAGGLAGERTASNLIAACRMLVQENPEVEEKLKVIFAGPLDSQNRKDFETQNKIVSHEGFLTYQQALALMQTAHVLVSIDLPISDPALAMFFPSKLLDYFLTKRKILALTTPGSTTAKVLEDQNAIILPLHDVELIKNGLLDMINEYEKRNLSFFVSQDIPMRYSAKENATKLADLICSW